MTKPTVKVCLWVTTLQNYKRKLFQRRKVSYILQKDIWRQGGKQMCVRNVFSFQPQTALRTGNKDLEGSISSAVITHVNTRKHMQTHVNTTAGVCLLPWNRILKTEKCVPPPPIPTAWVFRVWIPASPENEDGIPRALDKMHIFRDCKGGFKRSLYIKDADMCQRLESRGLTKRNYITFQFLVICFK